MINTFFRVQYERLFYLYHRVRNWWPIWYYLLNWRSRRLWKLSSPPLSSLQRRIVDDLRTNGIATASLVELFPDHSLFHKIRSYLDERLSDQHVRDEIAATERDLRDRMDSGHGKTKLHKDFWVNLWPMEGERSIVLPRNPFLKFLFDDRILAVVGSYLGSAPKLKNFSIQRTFVIPEHTPAVLSQRWHRDPEDKKMLKVFIYLSDVNELGDGPFTYVRGSQLGGAYRSLFPQRLPVGRYPDIGAVEKLVPERDRQPVLAKAGTVIFCDTSGLHKGGYSTKNPRTMFLSGFASAASTYPSYLTIRDTGEISSLSALACYALHE